MIRPILLGFLGFCLFYACQPDKKKDNQEVEEVMLFDVQTKKFGVTPNGDSVTQYILSNKNGLEVRIINYGGIVTNIMFPDKNGIVEDVVLGYDNLDDYIKATPYFGAIVGRYGNRIAKGKFSLNGEEYTLAVNNGENHLHGGLKGFDKVIWDAEPFINPESAGVKLHYLSEDMEEGYPGNLDVQVVYTIHEDNTIEINYSATTDKTTVVNITQHSYFNLTGNAKGDILGHEVMIKSNSMVPVDAGLIPTGVFLPVSGTPFDFNQLTTVGDRINNPDEQLKLGGGYDHCWVLDKPVEDALDWVVKAVDPTSGRVFELATTEPAVQFYTGNFLDGTLTGKYGVVYNQRYGMCFEPEHYPDSPNHPDFPSVVLNPEEEYNTTTIWKFSTSE